MSPLGPFARPEADSPAPGQIPGLRGAPMRTPVRTSGASSGPGLWPAVIGRLLTRQLWIELYGLPGYSLTLKGRPAQGFAATPRDFRPVDPAQGKTVLGGKFALAGSSLEAAAPADPWNRASPTRAFAVELHSFAWLPSLMLQGERGAREAVRLTLAWADAFARWSPFAWGPEILARRTINLACAARRMGQVATEAERLRLADILGRQGRQLLRPPGGLAGKAGRLTAAAIAGCTLAGGTGAGLRRSALRGLPGALDRTVGPDGGHASRSPEAGLELLLDLLTLDDALSQVSEATPDAVRATIRRLTHALRLQTLPDGRLITLQGGGPSTAARVAAGRAHDDAHSDAVSGTVAGVARIRSPLLTIAADIAAPARGAWSGAACAQPMALEIVCGKDRIVTGCGWTPRAPDRQGLRLAPGHSTLTLGEGSTGEPLGGWRGELLGHRLVGRPLHLAVDQRDGEGAVWLEVEHDGWVHDYGLLHQRRLYLDQRLDELRAEERLHPAPGHRDVVRAIAAPYAVRFQLEPGVQASLARDRRSILLRGHSGRGWWFRTDGPDVAIEPSVHIDEGLSRRSLQIVVRGSARTDSETKIRWKLSPAGAGGDPS
ncbi:MULTISPECIES: heparinase II/III family protein [unclassified Brevundimonas]|uniref:heparinase II/III family protein n=1 Tax=unclassified Brevundimonas TaxID=2622653 RepID=UPI0006F87E11|nr:MULTISPECIES: heparinase II/III family protein [unclassified Brevundimonas]KQY62316.1 heparinase [Brevundimonas sp. Root1423]KRA21714.1 heparinase [Brevundimonas sp. Root608]